MIKLEEANRQDLLSLTEISPETMQDEVHFNLSDEVDRKMYSDQTGRFPTMSYKGNKFIMVIFRQKKAQLKLQTALSYNFIFWQPRLTAIAIGYLFT